VYLLQAWSPQFVASGSVFRAQLLFMLAWFHAVVQERRTYVPQVNVQPPGPAHPPPAPLSADRVCAAVPLLCVWLCVYVCVCRCVRMCMCVWLCV
jgi:hypothetical protein